MSALVVFRRSGDRVEPHRAQWVYGRWTNGEPDPSTLSLVVGKRLPWSEVYGGHCDWLHHQITSHERASKRARELRRNRGGQQRPAEEKTA